MHGLLLNRVLAVFLKFSCSVCVREGAGLLKSSRKYEPVTQETGLNPNHDGPSTERVVPNQSSLVKYAKQTPQQHESLSRERKQTEQLSSI